MVVLGSQIELTPDNIYACANVVDPKTNVPVLGTESKVVYTDQLAFLTPAELWSFVEACVEHYGIFSTAFAHAFWAIDLAKLIPKIAAGTASPSSPADFGRAVIAPTEYDALRLAAAATSTWAGSTSLDGPPTLPSFAPLPAYDDRPEDDRPLVSPEQHPVFRLVSAHSMMRRVWEPPPHWETLAYSGTQARAYRAVQERLDKQLRRIEYAPPWKAGARGGNRGYAVFSRVSTARALICAKAILDDQYGPTIQGAVAAPTRGVAAGGGVDRG